ncbi:MAG: hypothetical protein A3H52_00475 [Candidatus Zambryskibacteria bacterium RIFCSPLOWO2_02_FULL_39_26]|nr:MAG: hypothetical protein A3H52_00475 [Candidatus Zambryskibacteria bacterium RIFCSPLOWO2_02_FULL_39_26]
MLVTFIQTYPFILAFLLGLIPAMVWLWFWLKEDTHPEPHKMLTLSFVGGMIAVLFVLPLQKIVYNYFSGDEFISFSLWASTEEVVKFVFIYFIALRNKATDEPVDDMIYLIVGALGFVTLENTLFLMDPIREGNAMGAIINGNLRFIGASLLHIMSSGTIGIFMGLSFYKPVLERRIYTFIGIIVAIVLHTAFNLFILNGTPENIFFVFGMVWLSVIVLLLLFEKVKHIRKTREYLKQVTN